MKNNSQRATLTGHNCTNAVTNRRPIKAASALDRTESSADYDCFAASQSQRVPARLRSRYLFDKQQFSTLEIGHRRAQYDDHLKREYKIPIDILMETIEVARPVTQQKRRWPDLSALPAMLKEQIERCRKFCFDFQSRHPGIRDFVQVLVESLAQARDQLRQGIAEILVFTSAEAEPGHIDLRSKLRRIGIHRPDVLAFRFAQQDSDTTEAMLPQVFTYSWPLKFGYAFCRFHHAEARVVESFDV